MKTFYAYIRVSTVKQGLKGSSLQEQRDAIETFAQRHGLIVIEWFEDLETAAKKGRAQFGRMMAALKKDKADGVILHKIDRGARNFWDWALLQDLIDAGKDVRFAHDDLDMRSRGGRLAADIQAVVAADYVRNLRDEVRKGMHGRLKQGLYPLKAPLGYLDNGSGKPKTIDPIKGPLVRQAFELYASRRYSYRTLRLELRKQGLARKNGAPLNLKSLTCILRNPFYAGVITIRSTGETYGGIHEPLISAGLFRRVRDILDGKLMLTEQRHDFLYRRRIKCKHCGTKLIGERQKGIVYYRCHTQGCPTKCIREDAISTRLQQETEALRFDDDELQELKPYLDAEDAASDKAFENRMHAARLRISAIEVRQSRLIDAYVDQQIDQQAYEARKTSLLLELTEAREALLKLEEAKGGFVLIFSRFLEFAKSFDCDQVGRDATIFQDALDSATSNWFADGKNLCITMQSPFKELISDLTVYSCGLHRYTPRTVGLPAGAVERSISPKDRRQVVDILKTHLKDWKPPLSLVAANDNEKREPKPYWFKPNNHRGRQADDDRREAA